MARRKIAQSILDMNWKHAILEIVLIVVGILIAIQIDNWNDDRKERQFEKKILNEIKIALEDDLENQIRTRLERGQRIASSATDVLNYLDGDIAYHDSLNYDFNRLGWIMIFEPKTSPFETLNSKGIEIVSDDNLRLALLNLYDYYYPRATFFTDRYNGWSEEYITPFLIQNFKFNREDQRNIPVDRNALKSNVIFKNLVIEKYDSTDDLAFRYERLDERVERLIAMIEEEIN